jgi:hypothetical protein
MAKTTIEIPEDTKEALREARLSHESNYGQTIDRLLGRGELVTEQKVREIIREETTDS